jgi:hypothetical protein
MQTAEPQPPPRQQILDFLGRVGDWIRRHEPELRAFITWGAVCDAGVQARLYVPRHAEAWRQIEEARRSADPPTEADYVALIVSLYGPDGIAFEALREELAQAPLLAKRTSDVGEVLASLSDGRYFVTVCGALPLVEHVLGEAAGKWSDPRKHLDAINTRLEGPISSDEEADLLIEMTAMEMVLNEIPEIWKNGRLEIGGIDERLNRHRALHGTARGWNDAANATRALLLLAATARVAGPLLGRPPRQDTRGN